MIAFGCAITDPRAYTRFAQPGLELVSEPDSVIFAHGSTSSIFHSYNVILDQVAELENLEALVLLHQDAEIIDPDFMQKARTALEDPEVALVGCGGAIGVTNISWWEGSVTWASFTTSFEELGGGEIPGLSWIADETPPYARTGVVDTIDGFVIVMSPWAIKNLRFDESLGKLHGYDLDLCLQARAAGKKVVTTDFRVIHHHSLKLIGDAEGWIAAHMMIADKWEDVLNNGAGEDWKRRARRAEAEADVARLRLRLTEQLVNQLVGQSRAMADSKSWKVTAPLRRMGNFVRRIRRRGEPQQERLRGIGNPGL
jgi:GT2 family glycosyltransferase